VSREAMSLEVQTGGFSSIYPVLREMEETGRIRRGHFVSGMKSAQLAVPGAVDRLRASRSSPLRQQAVLLAATDPAQPYGAKLDWPASRRAAARPRRRIGAAVVLVDGTPSLFVDRSGARVLCFDDERTERGLARLAAAARALSRGVARLGLKRLCVEEIDGESTRASDLSELFVRAGFRAGYRGLEVDRLADDAPRGLGDDGEEDALEDAG
jgi:ATP-dependent Lhr-like helicase